MTRERKEMAIGALFFIALLTAVLFFPDTYDRLGCSLHESGCVLGGYG